MNSSLNAPWGKTLGKGFLPRVSKGSATEDTWDYAPWKVGSERSERWKETLGRVSFQEYLLGVFSAQKIEEEEKADARGCDE